MRTYNTTHLHYCGVDLHARSLVLRAPAVQPGVPGEATCGDRTRVDVARKGVRTDVQTVPGFSFLFKLVGPESGSALRASTIRWITARCVCQNGSVIN